MKLLSIISEYNPFHNGHVQHLKISKEKTKCSHTLSIMSGSFLQRGEPALMDKWTRAKIAVLNGIDLVIELPFVFSCQTAEVFAYGAVKTLDCLNIDQYLSFGCEDDDLHVLMSIARILAEEPEEYVQILKTYLERGLSYPKSREIAVTEYLGLSEKLMNSSNNILAIEYLKWLHKFNSSIKPVLVKRQGPSYHGQEIINGIAGATYIRNMILSTGSRDAISQLVPQETYKEMGIYEDTNNYNFLENYSTSILEDLLRSSPEEIRRVFDVGEGLENRILNNLPFESVDDFIETVVSKRYTKTRIKRIIVNLMLRNYKADMMKIFKDDEFMPYIRVLAFNDKGKEIIREIKSKSELNIITNLSKDYRRLGEIQRYCIDKDVLATNYFFMKANREKMYLDYYKKPDMI